jgi:sugar phosphate isomerase/epimerase
MEYSVMDLGFAPLLKSGSITYNGFLDFCSSIEVDGVELYDGLLKELNVSELLEWLRELNLKVASIDIIASFAQPDEEKRRQGIEYCKKIMDLGHKLGSRHVMIVPVGLTAGNPMESAKRWTFDGLSECVDYGESIGIKSTVENPLYRYPAPLPETVKHMVEVAKKIPRLGICYDDGNFLSNGEDPLACLDQIASRVYHTHIKDYKYVDEGYEGSMQVGSKRVAYAPAGEGIIDFRGILKKLKQAGYRNYLSMEFMDGQRVKEGTAIGVKNLRQILKEI